MKDYRGKGDVIISYREEDLVAFILAVPRYLQKASYLNGYLDFINLDNKAPEVIQTILDLVAENYPLGTLGNNEGYVDIVRGFDDKINIVLLESFLDFLANLGFRVYADFEGKDADSSGYSWKDNYKLGRGIKDTPSYMI